MTKRLYDWRGEEINSGALVAYPRSWASNSIEMVEARVLRVEAAFGSLFVQPLRRSRSRLFEGDKLRSVKLTNLKNVTVIK